MLELKNIADVFTGLSIRTDSKNGAPFMRMSDLSEVRTGRAPTLARGQVPTVARAVRIKEGDLVVGARGDTTEVALATSPLIDAFVSVDLYLVRPNPNRVDPGFLAAFLEQPSAQSQLASGKQGSGLARLSKLALDNLLVPLPPLNRQRAIGALAQCVRDADDLFARIATLHAILGRERVRAAFRALD